MNNVVDEVLASSPRYNIYDNNATLLYSNVQIDLATQVTTQGTALNKALFDSIRDDLNTRLLIADKSTTAEAQQGTNDAHYMTPLKTKQQLQYLTKTGTGSNTSTTATTTIAYSSSNVPSGAKRVIVSGQVYDVGTTSQNSYFYINGTGLGIKYANADLQPTSISSTQIGFRYYGSSGKTFPFQIDIDLNSKTFTGIIAFTTYDGTHYWDYACSIAGNFTTLTNISISLRAGGGTSASTTSYTTTYIY